MAKIENTLATISDIADLMKKKGLTKVVFSESDFSLELEMAVPMMAAMTTSAVPATAAAPATAPPCEEKGRVIKSPIVGTYYNAPAPDKAPFVGVGKKVKKGDVLMIIESMKLMNEITSDMDGTVAEIFLSSGTAVEYDQKIMRIE